MHLVLKDRELRWFIESEEEWGKVVKCLKDIDIDSYNKHRLVVESFSNLFTIFDDDIVTRNFIYLYSARDENTVEVLDQSRMVRSYLNEETQLVLRNYCYQKGQKIELSTIKLIRDTGEEMIKMNIVMNSFDWKNEEECIDELPTTLLEQIIVLEGDKNSI